MRVASFGFCAAMLLLLVDSKVNRESAIQAQNNHCLNDKQTPKATCPLTSGSSTGTPFRYLFLQNHVNKGQTMKDP